jgi:hypothetical protein
MKFQIVRFNPANLSLSLEIFQENLFGVKSFTCKICLIGFFPFFWQNFDNEVTSAIERLKIRQVKVTRNHFKSIVP